MARPIKEGLDYFSHDTDAVNDEKIETLRALYGNDGYAFYFIMLERIYRSANSKLKVSDAETRQILARKVEVTPEKFEQMLNSALDIGCFDKRLFQKAGQLSSNGIQKRAKVVLDKRLKMKERYEKLKVSASETPQETRQKPDKVKESKVKESKVLKETAFINLFPEAFQKSAKFKKTWTDWIEHRKEIRHPLKKTGATKQVKMLSEYSINTAIAMIENSISQGYQGLFEVKGNNAPQEKDAAEMKSIKEQISTHRMLLGQYDNDPNHPRVKHHKAEIASLEKELEGM
jgi:hypothetical protein